MQVDMEERFCNMVKEMGCTCVTISHRPALVAFHDMVSSSCFQPPPIASHSTHSSLRTSSSTRAECPQGYQASPCFWLICLCHTSQA